VSAFVRARRHCCCRRRPGVSWIFRSEADCVGGCRSQAREQDPVSGSVACRTAPTRSCYYLRILTFSERTPLRFVQYK
jgi:hypothetical protein